MQALRKIVDVTGPTLTIDLPPDWAGLVTAEVIVLPINEADVTDIAAPANTMEDLVRRFYGAIPDFPDRAPQGEYEVRRSFDD